MQLVSKLQEQNDQKNAEIKRKDAELRRLREAAAKNSGRGPGPVPISIRSSPVETYDSTESSINNLPQEEETENDEDWNGDGHSDGHGSETSSFIDDDVDDDDNDLSNATLAQAKTTPKNKEGKRARAKKVINFRCKKCNMGFAERSSLLIHERASM